ncbi:hypothetical protein DL93DRAFT_2097042 [Clavulina sp. PMI_390]|nr:hypothetical protein DL93DRAFT_2097042 [Clavulina sp. PMI_390]
MEMAPYKFWPVIDQINDFEVILTKSCFLLPSHRTPNHALYDYRAIFTPPTSAYLPSHSEPYDITAPLPGASSSDPVIIDDDHSSSGLSDFSPVAAESSRAGRRVPKQPRTFQETNYAYSDSNSDSDSESPRQVAGLNDIVGEDDDGYVHPGFHGLHVRPPSRTPMTPIPRRAAAKRPRPRGEGEIGARAAKQRRTNPNNTNIRANNVNPVRRQQVAAPTPREHYSSTTHPHLIRIYEWVSLTGPETHARPVQPSRRNPNWQPQQITVGGASSIPSRASSVVSEDPHYGTLLPSHRPPPGRSVSPSPSAPPSPSQFQDDSDSIPAAGPSGTLRTPPLAPDSMDIEMEMCSASETDSDSSRSHASSYTMTTGMNVDLMEEDEVIPETPPSSPPTPPATSPPQNLNSAQSPLTPLMQVPGTPLAMSSLSFERTSWSASSCLASPEHPMVPESSPSYSSHADPPDVLQRHNSQSRTSHSPLSQRAISARAQSAAQWDTISISDHEIREHLPSIDRECERILQRSNRGYVPELSPEMVALAAPKRTEMFVLIPPYTPGIRGGAQATAPGASQADQPAVAKGKPKSKGKSKGKGKAPPKEVGTNAPSETPIRRPNTFRICIDGQEDAEDEDIRKSIMFPYTYRRQKEEQRLLQLQQSLDGEMPSSSPIPHPRSHLAARGPQSRPSHIADGQAEGAGGSRSSTVHRTNFDSSTRD